MPVDHPTFGTFCAICYEHLDIDNCVIDKDGHQWDVCKGDCAKQAGIDEATETIQDKS